MRIKIGVENHRDGNSIAWALDFPGCFASGRDGSEAILRVPESLLRYKEWVDSHPGDSWLKDLTDFDIHLEESVEVMSPKSNNQTRLPGEASAWFQYDGVPLTAEEISRGRKILSWSREDLLELVAGLSSTQMDFLSGDESWSISRILGHIADVEYESLGNLGLANLPRQALQADVFERLLKVRQNLDEALSSLAGVQKITEVNGEFWSARKMLRLTAQHEIDHIQQIFNLMARL
ncbi:MAG: DinB family protein [Anaerolineaceae bacterium]|nr:DinB family protein [Anaerolineaceae bacterium]